MENLIAYRAWNDEAREQGHCPEDQWEKLKQQYLERGYHVSEMPKPGMSWRKK